MAHGDGNYFADDETLDRLEGEGRVVFRYAPGDNPNGSSRNIAGILNEKRNVLGLMPHPERVIDSAAWAARMALRCFQSLIESRWVVRCSMVLSAGIVVSAIDLLG